ncbi:hypothetical protein JD844_015286 [Phrynosoma platyrhinos]|uniref:Rho-GAP domain-containing protein n=1 Tax=Phrynosoma platyrhinos TaxID=52577 RepID=A0ABQ7T8F7_PHRPL|nr:hypothetical protein JD844_015286 [Phrynosoma platyrhinos]
MHAQSYTFLISSDYERAEWREIIREQQKKCTVSEKESANKMSLHNLATVFGPTLLRPSEKDSKIPANPSQPIAMTDSWSLEVMSQVQVLLYFLQLETIPTPDSKRQSILFSTEV